MSLSSNISPVLPRLSCLITRYLLSGLLSACLIATVFQPACMAQYNATSTSAPIAQQFIQLNKPLELKGVNQTITMTLRGVNVLDALRAIGRKGHFNVVANDSVEGILSMDFNHVSIADALDAIRIKHNLTYATRAGNTLLVYANGSEKADELRRTHSEIIPLRHTNATVIADMLNFSVFAQINNNQNNAGQGSSRSASNSGNQQTFQTVTPDFRTNSLIVVGTESDINIALQYVHALDIPRGRRTWRLSHSDAVDVATMLASSLFNEGIPTFQVGGGQGAGGGQQQQQQQTMGQFASFLRIREENIEEGEGSSSTQPSGVTDSEAGNEITLRGTVKEDAVAQVRPTGVIIVPDTRLNTITVLGTPTQIELAAQAIAAFDRKAPQVVIETALVEISETAAKELGFNFGLDRGDFLASANNVSNNNFATTGGSVPFTNVGVPTQVAESLFRFSTSAATGTANNFFYQLNALIEKDRAKLLANPNIVTMHEKEAIVSIVDEIIESITITIDSTTGGALGREVNIGEVGITLSILPKISPNGSINMRVRPRLSTIASTQTDSNNNLITLLSRREALAQNIKLQDGETFILGGLIQETDTDSASKVPFFGDLPIVGALMRSSAKNKNRSELLIMLTPHIIQDELTNSGGQRNNGYLPNTQPLATMGGSDDLAQSSSTPHYAYTMQHAQGQSPDTSKNDTWHTQTYAPGVSPKLTPRFNTPHPVTHTRPPAIQTRANPPQGNNQSHAPQAFVTQQQQKALQNIHQRHQAKQKKALMSVQSDAQLRSVLEGFASAR